MALPSLPSLPNLGQYLDPFGLPTAPASAPKGSGFSLNPFSGDFSTTRIVAFVVGFMLVGIGLLGLIASGALSAVEGVQTHPAVRLAEKAGVA